MKSYQRIINSDAYFMSRCLELAKKGLGNTYPNPLVGCVIVHKNIIISEGWHKKSGRWITIVLSSLYRDGHRE